MAVDQYIGGIEHAVLHLLYARFFTKVCRDLGLSSVGEPFANLLTQGMVCKESYRCPTHGYRLPGEVDAERRCRECGQPVEVGRTEKMSKSKKNVVDPDELLEQHGADTIRVFSLFAAPPEKDLEWSDEGVQGAFRFLNRVWRLAEERAVALRGVPAPRDGGGDEAVRDLRRVTHQTIQRVTRDLEKDFHFNTALAALMELTTALMRYQEQSLDPVREGSLDSVPPAEAPERVRAFAEGVRALLVMLAPFAPHMTEELWALLGSGGSIFRAPWPTADPVLAREETVELVVQVNGKLRARLQVPRGAGEGRLRELALGDERVRQWVGAKSVRKVVVIPDKLVNVVVG
jgi:leucyl-tRNA synthetase